MKPLTSLEVSLASVCAQKPGLPLEYVVDHIKKCGGTPIVVRLVRAVRRLQEGKKVAGEVGRLAAEWVRWVDCLQSRRNIK